MRDAIALQTSMIAREMKRELVQGWLNVSAEELPAYCQRYGWAIDGDQVTVPLNKENEAKTTVFRESVLFSRKSLPLALLWGVVLCSYAAVQSSTTSLGGASSRLPSDLPYAGRGIVFIVFYFLRYAFVYIDGLRERFRNGFGAACDRHDPTRNPEDVTDCFGWEYSVCVPRRRLSKSSHRRVIEVNQPSPDARLFIAWVHTLKVGSRMD